MTLHRGPSPSSLLLCTPLSQLLSANSVGQVCLGRFSHPWFGESMLWAYWPEALSLSPWKATGDTKAAQHNLEEGHRKAASHQPCCLQSPAFLQLHRLQSWSHNLTFATSPERM